MKNQFRDRRQPYTKPGVARETGRGIQGIKTVLPGTGVHVAMSTKTVRKDTITRSSVSL